MELEEFEELEKIVGKFLSEQHEAIFYGTSTEINRCEELKKRLQEEIEPVFIEAMEKVQTGWEYCRVELLFHSLYEKKTSKFSDVCGIRACTLFRPKIVH